MESKLLNQVLAYLCEDLGGDWLLGGGSLVRLSFDESRGTEDIDLVRVRHPNLSDEASRNRLYQWLMREIPNWEGELVVLLEAAQGRVLRPAYLKLRRGSEVDVQDIAVAVEKCPEGFDEAKFRSWPDSKVWARFTQVRSKVGL